jgi:hypothetical protein
MFGLKGHGPVVAKLIQAGVALRRYSPRLKCRLCDKPALKIRHSGNGSEYGGLCVEHREVHYRLLNRALSRKNRNINPENYNDWRCKENEEQRKWLRENRQLLRQVQRASLDAMRLPEASQSPKKVLRLVTTSPE